MRESGCAANSSRLANGLPTKRIRRRGRLGAPQDVIRNGRRPRDRVVHELSGKKLAILVVDGFLHERSTDRLSDATLHLTFNQKRIYLLTAVVDCDIFQDLHLTGVAIHLDRNDVGPERERAVGRLEEARCLEPRLESGRQVFRDVSLARELAPSKSVFLFSTHEEFPIRELDLLMRRLEERCG